MAGTCTYWRCQNCRALSPHLVKPRTLPRRVPRRFETSTFRPASFVHVHSGARKEVRSETLGLKKSVGAYRAEIAALKRRTQALEQELRRLSKASPRVAPVAANVESLHSLRFSVKGLASQRQRLALSADDCGLFVGASGQSIYNWEAGKARPRAKHLPAIAALRALGKKEAATRLATLRAVP